jgi:hypothetical protein
LENRHNKDIEHHSQRDLGRNMSWKPVAGIVALRDQVNKRWPDRDKRSDGIVGDTAHQARPSDHNPDSRGLVHAIDIDEDLRGSKNDNVWLADQIIAYARMKRPGSSRLKYVIYENQIASGTHGDHFWTWRGDNYDHTIHMHISFTNQGENDSNIFNIPILVNGTRGVWDGVTPYYDILANAAKTGAANKATWRLACRLRELGFYQGTVLPEGRQGYPKAAIRSMQDYMGWTRRDYDQKTHRAIWKELKISNTEA